MIDHIASVPGPAIAGPGSQRAFWFLGALSVLRVAGSDTGGAFAIGETTSRRGSGSPLHVHDRDDETFYVLEGELRLIVGDDEYTAGPGTVAVLPRRLRHAYVVTSPTARFITFHSPAGFEGFVAAIGEPAVGMDLPPESQAPPDLDALVKSAAQFGITVVGPVPAA